MYQVLARYVTQIFIIDDDKLIVSYEFGKNIKRFSNEIQIQNTLVMSLINFFPVIGRYLKGVQEIC